MIRSISKAFFVFRLLFLSFAVKQTMCLPIFLGAFLISPDLARADVVHLSDMTDESSDLRIPSAKSENTSVAKLRRSLSVGFFNFTSVNMEQAHQQAGRLDAYNYFNIDYHIDRSRKISLRPVFQWGTAGTDFKDEYKAGDFKLGDSFIDFIDYNLVELPFDLELSGQMRVYAPTSVDSSAHGMIARVRPWLILTRNLSRDLSVALNFEPDYYFQSRTGFLTDYGAVRGNRHFAYESQLELNYRFMGRLGGQVAMGHNETWSYAVPIEGVNEAYHQEDLTIDASLNTSFGGVFMVGGVSQKRDVARPRGKYAFMRSSESQYYLLTSMRF
jgi:hypothetical protein